MSDNNKDNLDKKLADAKALAKDMLHKRQPVVVSKESVVEVAKRHSAKDIILWLIALACLVATTLVAEYLGGVWAPANNTWIKLGIMTTLVVLALVCLALTHQGGAFKTLLKDASIELRRITWPSKQETTTYTWQVVVVTIIAGILVWLIDTFFNYVVGLILG